MADKVSFTSRLIKFDIFPPISSKFNLIERMQLLRLPKISTAKIYMQIHVQLFRFIINHKIHRFQYSLRCLAICPTV